MMTEGAGVFLWCGNIVDFWGAGLSVFLVGRSCEEYRDGTKKRMRDKRVSGFSLLVTSSNEGVHFPEFGVSSPQTGSREILWVAVFIATDAHADEFFGTGVRLPRTCMRIYCL